jgi:ribosomal protein S11
MNKNKTNIFILKFFFSSNNIIVNVGYFDSDFTENKFYQNRFSSGLLNFKKSNRSTFFAIQNLVQRVIESSLELKKPVILICDGVNRFKSYVVRQIVQSQLEVLRVVDRTKIPHNGCRFRKFSK